MSCSSAHVRPVPVTHGVQALNSTVTQPNSDFKVEAVLNMTRDTIFTGGITRHDSGGKETTKHLGTWVRQRCLARGGFGVVYLERNPSSGAVRAVKRLEGGNIPLYDREIAQMIKLLRVNRSTSGRAGEKGNTTDLEPTVREIVRGVLLLVHRPLLQHVRRDEVPQRGGSQAPCRYLRSVYRE